MHGMASDRHVMVGMVGSPRVDAHRARRGAARRHLSEFRSKDYCSAGEKKPTTPNRESAHESRISINFPSRHMGSRLQLGGSDFFHMQGNSLCCEIQTGRFIPICIVCDTRTDQGNHIHRKYAFWFGRQSANVLFFKIHVQPIDS